ncbi:MAG: hypothetical protein H7Z41_17070 [Cytophagales bacterium]|nr:hypothetical protein [Armatimonadota bacterium]
MDELLREALKRAGWRSGTHRGFLMTGRAGIEFQVGAGRTAGEGRLELRYRYRTAQSSAEGDVALPSDATLARIEDEMTAIYLRIHEKPDVSRVFRSRTGATPKPTPTASETQITSSTPPLRQGELEL